MREQTYFILAALQDQARHGYAIIKRAEELSGGRVRLATGTLYSALDRLAGEAHVEVVSEEIVNGRTRRTYALTSNGRAALQAEAKQLAAAARVVTSFSEGRLSSPEGRLASPEGRLASLEGRLA